MDMYQKRKERKKDKVEDKNKSCTSVSINWDISIYGNTPLKSYEISIL